mmetsp:Transcript_75241/g.135540  ORF Transcript_75241/g.135540 Transcript_75241/m.135540 type:complete len:401 (+) Transcript_75241:288-1490(+)
MRRVTHWYLASLPPTVLPSLVPGSRALHRPPVRSARSCSAAHGAVGMLRRGVGTLRLPAVGAPVWDCGRFLGIFPGAPPSSCISLVIVGLSGLPRSGPLQFPRLLCQVSWYLRVGRVLHDARQLLQHLGPVVELPRGVHGQERNGRAPVADAPGAPDALHVDRDLEGQVVVHHVRDPADVQPARGQICGHHHVDLPLAEPDEVGLPLDLRQVAVQSSRVCYLFVPQLFVQALCLGFAVREDKHAVAGLFSGRPVVDQTDQGLVLLLWRDLDHHLRHRAGSAADGAHRHEEVLVEEVPGQLLDGIWKGRREHHGLTVLLAWHAEVLHQRPHAFIHVSHLQHPVSLVEDKAVELGQRDDAAGHEVPEPAWGGDADVGAFGDFEDLVLHALLPVDPYDPEVRL